jgi:hypothetical protein
MASDVIDQVVRAFLDAPLREAGFTRKARAWNRRRGSLVDVVDVQASRWNEPGNRSFTVNLGVFAPSVYRICWQKEPPSFVREEECLVRCRLSEGLSEMLYGKQKEQWWTIHDSADVDKVGKEVAGLLASGAIPFFDKVDSLPAIHDVLEKSARPKTETPLARIYLAVVKAELGDSATAQSILKDIGTTAPSAWRERVSAVEGELSRKSA